MIWASRCGLAAGIFPATRLFAHRGLRVGLLVGAALNALGAVLRWQGAVSRSFLTAFVGQTICAQATGLKTILFFVFLFYPGLCLRAVNMMKVGGGQMLKAPTSHSKALCSAQFSDFGARLWIWFRYGSDMELRSSLLWLCSLRCSDVLRGPDRQSSAERAETTRPI